MFLKKAFMAFALAFLAICAVSCTTFRVSGIEYARQPGAKEIVGHFDIVVRLHQFFGVSNGMHLANITARAMDPAIVEAVRAEIAAQGGNRAVDVKITYRASFADLLLNHLTVRIWAPARAHVTGIIVR